NDGDVDLSMRVMFESSEEEKASDSSTSDEFASPVRETSKLASTFAHLTPFPYTFSGTPAHTDDTDGDVNLDINVQFPLFPILEHSSGETSSPQSSSSVSNEQTSGSVSE